MSDKKDDLVELNKRIEKITSDLSSKSTSDNSISTLNKDQDKDALEDIKKNKSEENLIEEETKLTKAKEKELKNARSKVVDSNALPGSVPVGGSSDSFGGFSDSQEKKEERNKEIEDEKTSITEDVQNKIESAKTERDSEIETAKEGPNGILAIFSNNIFFILLGIIDSGVSAIPVVGDMIMAVILAVIWFIPALLTFDLFLYLRILFFILIDWAVGTFGGTIANIIPVVGDAAVDFIPELFVFLTHQSPSDLVKKTYYDKLPAIIVRIKEKYDIKISEIKANGKDKIKFALKHIKGHFAGVASEGKKVIFMLLIVLIVYLSQFMSYFGFGSSQQIIFTVLFVLVLFVLEAMGVIGMREFSGLVGFLIFNILFKYILESDSLLSKYIGSGNSMIVIVIFIIFSLLLIFKVAKPESMSFQRMVGIMAIIFLVLSVPYLIGYMGSENFIRDIERQSLEQEMALDNLNPMERLTQWYIDMQARGKGEYIPVADKERTHEFIGVNLDGVEATRKEFLEGRPVQFNIYYSTGSKEDIPVRTTCKALGINGVITPSEKIPASELYTPTVKCSFGGLTKGEQLVTINSYYDFDSQVQIPLMFMSEQKFEEILEGNGNPSDFEGGVNKPITSSGPIDLGVSNFNGGELRMPLVINSDKLEDFPQLINVRLVNPQGNTRTQGNLEQIKSVVFNLPEGLRLGNCNFQEQPELKIEPTSTVDGRWKVDITDKFKTLDQYETISCNMYIDRNHLDKFIPVGTDFSIHTMYYDVSYTYKLEQRQPVSIR